MTTRRTVLSLSRLLPCRCRACGRAGAAPQQAPRTLVGVNSYSGRNDQSGWSTPPAADSDSRAASTCRLEVRPIAANLRVLTIRRRRGLRSGGGARRFLARRVVTRSCGRFRGMAGSSRNASKGARPVLTRPFVYGFDLQNGSTA